MSKHYANQSLPFLVLNAKCDDPKSQTYTFYWPFLLNVLILVDLGGVKEKLVSKYSSEKSWFIWKTRQEALAILEGGSCFEYFPRFLHGWI